MGMWSIVKKALNSKNPADANYKSLSELLDEIVVNTELRRNINVLGTLSQKLNYLISQSVGGVTISASDERQEVFFTEQKTFNSGYTKNLIAQFTPTVNGSVKLSFTVGRSSSSSTAYSTVGVYTNSSASGNHIITDAYTGKDFADRSVTFSVGANTTYYIFYGQSNGTSASIQNYIKNLALNYTVNTQTDLFMKTETK